MAKKGWYGEKRRHSEAAKKGWKIRKLKGSQQRAKIILSRSKKESEKQSEAMKEQKEINKIEQNIKKKMLAIKNEKDWDEFHKESISILKTDEGDKLYQKHGSFTNMFYNLTDRNPILFEDENIILKELGVSATLKFEGDNEGKEMLIDIAKFISEKEKKVSRRHKFTISVGTQPISLAGDNSFRCGIPPIKWNEVRNMFPYDFKVVEGKGGYLDLEKEGIPSRLLWATHDNFHEYCHTLGEKDEKTCDRFALKMTKEYLKKRGN